MIHQSLHDKAVVLIDDECVLCNSSAHYIVNHDKKNIFRITSLLADEGKELLLQNGYENKELQSVVLIWQEKIYSKSDAALKIFELLDQSVLVRVLKLIPKVTRNFIYDLISKYRYSIFGKSRMCKIPDEKYRMMFI